MNPRQGVRAGNDLWLNPNSTNSNPLNRSDATDVYCARKSAKNILFTYIDTYNYALTHDAEADDRYSVTVGLKTVNSVFAWWKPVLYAVDAVAVLSMALVVFFMFKPKKAALVTVEGVEIEPDDTPKIDNKNLKKKELLQKKIDKLKSELSKLTEELNKLE